MIYRLILEFTRLASLITTSKHYRYLLTDEFIQIHTSVSKSIFDCTKPISLVDSVFEITNFCSSNRKPFNTLVYLIHLGFWEIFQAFQWVQCKTLMGKQGVKSWKVWELLKNLLRFQLVLLFV